jgi:tetratricopeptide (TPR) repeat protein
MFCKRLAPRIVSLAILAFILLLSFGYTQSDLRLGQVSDVVKLVNAQTTAATTSSTTNTTSTSTADNSTSYQINNRTNPHPIYNVVGPQVKIKNKNVSELISKAESMEAQGKLSEAVKYYDKALQIDPNNIYALDYKGSDLIRLGNSTEVIKYADKALSIDPKYEDALATKGNGLSSLGNYSGAI